MLLLYSALVHFFSSIFLTYPLQILPQLWHNWCLASLWPYLLSQSDYVLSLSCLTLKWIQTISYFFTDSFCKSCTTRQYYWFRIHSCWGKTFLSHRFQQRLLLIITALLQPAFLPCCKNCKLGWIFLSLMIVYYIENVNFHLDSIFLTFLNFSQARLLSQEFFFPFPNAFIHLTSFFVPLTPI